MKCKFNSWVTYIAGQNFAEFLVIWLSYW